MPGSLSARAGVLVAAAAMAAPASARADSSPCGPAATVSVEIAPGLDPSAARRVVEQILAEVSSAANGDCAARSKTHIEVQWLTGKRVHLVVTAQGATDAERAERDLDLSGVSADGRLLAIAIAADELLTEARARLRLAEARVPEPTPAATTAAPPPRPARRAGIGLGFGPTLSMDLIGKNLLLGPDARAALWLTPHLSFSVRAGLRAATAGLGPEPWAAAVVGGRAWVSPFAWDLRRGAAFSLGADALALRTSASVAVRAVPTAGLSGWMRAGSSLVLVGDLGLGAALGGPVGAGASSRPPFALSTSLGVVVPF